jgi:hypothetical protein
MCSPVADVVLADYIVAEEFEHSADAIADDCAPQMADVHLLGDVRSRKINDNSLRLRCLVYAKTIQRIGVDFNESVCNEISFQSQIYKTRARNLGLLAYIADL